MATELRRVPFIAALVLLALSFLGEIGLSRLAIRPPSFAEIGAGASSLAGGVDPPVAPGRLRAALQSRTSTNELSTPGLGIRALGFVDGLLLFTLGLMALSLLIPEGLHGRVQGILTLLVSLVVLIGGFIALLATIALLFVMLGLLLAVPFGTVAYLVMWGDFPKAAAAITLSALLAMKLAAFVCLAVANPRFLENKGLVLLALTAVLASAIVAFLHGLVPSVLVSIADAVAAIVVEVLALIWAVVFLVGSLIAIVRLLIKQVSAAT